MSEQIKNHEVEKTYIALVKGFVKENEATINMPIGRSTKDRKKMAVSKNGKNAVTHFKVIERFENRNWKNSSNKGSFISNRLPNCWRCCIF